MEDIVFKARIIEKNRESKVLILNRSLFYPDGKGGQLGDRGRIDNAKVVKVYEREGRILHIVDKIPKEDEVECVIDGKRREDISIQHTSQHILSRIILDLFNSKTLGFHMGEEVSTIDIDNLNIGNEDSIEKIETEANRIVREDRLVKIYTVNEKELEKLDIRKAVKVSKDIRIVEIEDFDRTMCGGTHVGRTGSIGVIKIIKFEKIKGDVLRFYFVAGERALKDYQLKWRLVRSLSNKFTTGEDRILDSVDRLEEKLTELKRRLKLIKEELFEYYLKEEEGKDIVIKGFYNLSMEDLKFLSHEFVKRGAKFVYIFNSERGIINKSLEYPINLSTILKELKEKFNVKGGGRDFISIKTDRTLEVGDYLWSIVRSQ